MPQDTDTTTLVMSLTGKLDKGRYISPIFNNLLGSGVLKPKRQQFYVNPRKLKEVSNKHQQFIPCWRVVESSGDTVD